MFLVNESSNSGNSVNHSEVYTGMKTGTDDLFADCIHHPEIGWILAASQNSRDIPPGLVLTVHNTGCGDLWMNINLLLSGWTTTGTNHLKKHLHHVQGRLPVHSAVYSWVRDNVNSWSSKSITGVGQKGQVSRCLQGSQGPGAIHGIWRQSWIGCHTGGVHWVPRQSWTGSYMGAFVHGEGWNVLHFTPCLKSKKEEKWSQTFMLPSVGVSTKMRYSFKPIFGNREICLSQKPQEKKMTRCCLHQRILRFCFQFLWSSQETAETEIRWEYSGNQIYQEWQTLDCIVSGPKTSSCVGIEANLDRVTVSDCGVTEPCDSKVKEQRNHWPQLCSWNVNWMTSSALRSSCPSNCRCNANWTASLEFQAGPSRFCRRQNAETLFCNP